MNEKTLYRNHVEKIGHCERCGSTQTLQLHHIKTRKIKKLRNDPANWLVLCYDCHFNFFHKEPKKANEWLWENRPDVMEYLQEKLKENVK